jgi:hypothetical protein
VDLIRRDLEVARTAWVNEAASGIEREGRDQSDFLIYRDSEGRVADFHSLRHRFVSELVRAGVAPKDAKELARHSTITLTMDRYAHVGIRDTAAAVARLTVPNGNRDVDEPASLRMTGTDEGCTSYVPPDVPTGGSGRGKMRMSEENSAATGRVVKTSQPLRLERVEDDREQKREIHPEGFEPSTFGSVERAGSPRKHTERLCFQGESYRLVSLRARVNIAWNCRGLWIFHGWTVESLWKKKPHGCGGCTVQTSPTVMGELSMWAFSSRSRTDD